jgi:diguanylate cyclase (GGDEF)-like protein/PAS domain S-box-containing protein
VPDDNEAIDRIARRAIDRLRLRGSVLIDSAGLVQWMSPSIEALIGFSADEFVGRDSIEFLHPDDVGISAALLAFEETIDPSIRDGARYRYTRDLQVRCRDGSFRLLEVAITNYLNDPEIGYILLDIAAPNQHHVLERVMEMVGRGDEPTAAISLLLSEFTTADPWQPAAVVVDEHGDVIAATSNAPRPYGSATDDDFRNSWEVPLAGQDGSQHLGSLRVWCHFESPNPMDVESSERIARRIALLLSHDRMAHELRQAAERDALTGVHNRRALASRFRDDCLSPVTVAYLDLDGFKDVNDRFGHAAGDAVLVAIAGRLRAAVRLDDVVARVGGDEFVVVLGAPHESVGAIVERLSFVASTPVEFNGELLDVQASIGVVTGTGSVDALIRAADERMLGLKGSAAGRVQR